MISFASLSSPLPIPVLAIVLFLQGCAGISEHTAVPQQVPAIAFPDEARYGERPAIPQPAEILALTQQQRDAFLRYFNDPYYQYVPAHSRVFSYLEGFTDGFHYQGDTLTASEAFAVNGGNCLSLALMTTALADIAGVRIGYQLLDDMPVYEMHGTVVEKGFHVRSILYDTRFAQNSGNVSLSAGLKVDYFPTGQEHFIANLSRDNFIAMYYRNVAASAITVNDYARAYWYLRESLQYAANDSQAINMLAVVSRRTGDPARAEELYRHGLAHSEEKLTLLKNYHMLLVSQQRMAEAEQVQQQLDRINDPSPFHWFQLARESFEAEEYGEAIRYYRRALDIAPYMHEAYLGIAQAQYESGNDADAVASLQHALENVYRPKTRQLYKAKLYTLMQQEP